MFVSRGNGGVASQTHSRVTGVLRGREHSTRGTAALTLPRVAQGLRGLEHGGVVFSRYSGGATQRSATHCGVASLTHSRVASLTPLRIARDLRGRAPSSVVIACDCGGAAAREARAQKTTAECWAASRRAVRRATHARVARSAAARARLRAARSGVASLTYACVASLTELELYTRSRA